MALALVDLALREGDILLVGGVVTLASVGNFVILYEIIHGQTCADEYPVALAFAEEFPCTFLNDVVESSGN